VENLGDNTNPSGTTTYKFTMPEDEAYDVEVVANFQSRISIAEAVVTLDETTFTYDGAAKEPAVSSVVLGTTALTASTDYTFEYSNNTDAGTATVTVTGQGIYTDVATTTFTINKAALSNLTVSITGWTYGKYNAENNSPSVQGNTGSGNVTYTYADATAAEPSYSETVPTNAGSYIVKATVAETDNYAAGEATKTFTIAKADITPSIDIEGWTYGDTPNEPVVEGNLGSGTVTITYEGDNLAEPSTTAPTQAGGYTVKVSIAETANYNAGETLREFSIDQADFSQVVIANIADQTYTGSAITPDLTVTFKGNPVDASEYTIGYNNEHTDVGTVTITLTTTEKNFTQGDTNPTKTFNIVAAAATITAENQTVTYNGTEQQFENYEGDDVEVMALYYASEADREANENQLEVVVNAGTYYVKLVSGDENYAFTPVYATFIIEPKSITDDMLWSEIDENGVTYTGEPIVFGNGMFGLTDEIDNEDVDLEENQDYTVAYANNTNIGTATVTLTGVGNYTGEVTFTFDIVRNLNITFSDNRQWATYYADENLQIPEGLKAYIVTNISESVVTVGEISYIPQHVGVLLTYEGNIDELPEEFLAKAYTGATQDFNNNKLQGSSTAVPVSSITGGAVYVLYNNEFVKSTTGTIPANRAYLVLDDAVYGDQGARSLIIVIDEYSGIETIDDLRIDDLQFVYDLQGRRIANGQWSKVNGQSLKKGLVIVNGKKIFVK